MKLNRIIRRSHHLKVRGAKYLASTNGKDGAKMPKYKYKFCDGTESVVEVSDEHYALLTALDKQEKQNNRSQGRRSIPLATLQKKDNGKDGV